MNLIANLQKLDDLIVEHTRPPVTAMLRRQLSFAIEEAEAYQASSDKQDHTLATQIETIDRLVKEKEESDTKLIAFQKKHLPEEAEVRAWNKAAKEINDREVDMRNFQDD